MEHYNWQNRKSEDSYNTKHTSSSNAIVENGVGEMTRNTDEINFDNLTIERASELYQFVVYPECGKNDIPKEWTQAEYEQHIKNMYPELIITDIDNPFSVFMLLIETLQKHKHYVANLFRSVYDNLNAGFNVPNEIETWIQTSTTMLALDESSLLPPFPSQVWLNNGGFSGKKEVIVPREKKEVKLPEGRFRGGGGDRSDYNSYNQSMIGCSFSDSYKYYGQNDDNDQDRYVTNYCKKNQSSSDDLYNFDKACYPY